MQKCLKKIALWGNQESSGSKSCRIKEKSKTFYRTKLNYVLRKISGTEAFIISCGFRIFDELEDLAEPTL